ARCPPVSVPTRTHRRPSTSPQRSGQPLPRPLYCRDSHARLQRRSRGSPSEGTRRSPPTRPRATNRYVLFGVAPLGAHAFALVPNLPPNLFRKLRLVLSFK